MGAATEVGAYTERAAYRGKQGAFRGGRGGFPGGHAARRGYRGASCPCAGAYTGRGLPYGGARRHRLPRREYRPAATPGKDHCLSGGL